MANITLKSTGSDRLLSLLKGIDDGVPKALYNTLKSAQAKAKVEASKKIRTQLGLTKSYIDQHLSVGKPTYSNLVARIYASKRGILMTRFSHKPLKSGGLSVKIKPGSAFKKMPNAFLIARLKNSQASGIAIREGGKLKVLHAPSPSQVLNTFLPELSDEMGTFVSERLEKEVATILRRRK